MINLLCTLPTLSINFEINILDQLFDVYLLLYRRTHFKRIIVNFSVLTINPELGLELEIILNASKRWVEFVGFILKQIKCTWYRFVRCHMNDVTIPHA